MSIQHFETASSVPSLLKKFLKKPKLIIQELLCKNVEY